jgi:bifunctional oligoribonuclease and PAP phosphatase NrnA
MTQHEVPAQRLQPLLDIIAAVQPATDVALVTHVNADGDGTGSQVAMAGWLTDLGKRVTIVNPTPFPEAFRFLVPEPSLIADAGTAAGDAALQRADLVIVLDTAEAGRVGRVAKRLHDRAVVVIDHHVKGPELIEGLHLIDATACAAGELVYDLLLAAGLPQPWSQTILEGVYTAIVTDTGSFRFSNTTRRAHAIAGELIVQGVDPELMYRRIFATVPLRRIELLRHALGHLEVDDEFAITTISIERGVMERLGATSEDIDGLIDHARSIEGTEVAILMRETADGSTKISLRSAGAADVNAIARQFGGGGHVKASGALMPERMDAARPKILQATRDALRTAGMGFRAAPRDA